MKRLVRLLSVAAFVLGACGTASLAADDATSTRWDKRMAPLEEVKIWSNLIVGYRYGNSAAAWPARKQLLQRIVTEHPDSQWADDAAIILACGLYEFEGQAEASINAFREILVDYPEADTVVVPLWILGHAVHLDETWVQAVSALKYLGRDGIREGTPYNHPRAPLSTSRGMLAYFDHLRKYPIRTRDVVRVLLSNVYAQNKDFPAAIRELETLLSSTDGYEAAVVADKARALGRDGLLVVGIDRPQERAFVALMAYYRIKGDRSKSEAKTQRFSAIASKGIRTSSMRYAAQAYKALGMSTKARAMYTRALAAVDLIIVADIEQRKQAAETEGDPDPEGRPREYHVRLKAEIRERMEKLD